MRAQSIEHRIPRTSIVLTPSVIILFSCSAFNSNLILQPVEFPKWYMGNRASNDRLSFIEATGSFELSALLQNGNLGIGTISPPKRLGVIGTSKSRETSTPNIRTSPSGFMPRNNLLPQRSRRLSDEVYAGVDRRCSHSPARM
jgi:hypothetical protein